MNQQVRNETDFILAGSFKQLVLEKPVEKITIKDITDRSGVIRPTFYNHFQDKYELLEWIITSELLEPMQPLVKAGMITEAVVLLFTNMEKERSFYTRLHKMDGPISFHEIANRCVEEILNGIFEELASMNKEENKNPLIRPRLLAKYYANAMNLIAEDWIDAGMTISPRDMGEAFNLMITSSMEDLVNQL